MLILYSGTLETFMMYANTVYNGMPQTLVISTVSLIFLCKAYARHPAEVSLVFTRKVQISYTKLDSVENRRQRRSCFCMITYALYLDHLLMTLTPMVALDLLAEQEGCSAIRRGSEGNAEAGQGH